MGQIKLELNESNPEQLILKIWDRTLPKELRDILKKQDWAWEGVDQAGSGNDKYWAKSFDSGENENKLWNMILTELEKIGAKVKAKK